VRYVESGPVTGLLATSKKVRQPVSEDSVNHVTDQDDDRYTARDDDRFADVVDRRAVEPEPLVVDLEVSVRVLDKVVTRPPVSHAPTAFPVRRSVV
jgi:hypothetical protein